MCCRGVHSPASADRPHIWALGHQTMWRLWPKGPWPQAKGEVGHSPPSPPPLPPSAPPGPCCSISHLRSDGELSPFPVRDQGSRGSAQFCGGSCHNLFAEFIRQRRRVASATERRIERRDGHDTQGLCKGGDG